MAEQSLAPDRFYVYVHSRLSTGAPFYVGKGSAKRAYKHGNRSPHWKNIVAKDGGFRVNFIAEHVDEELVFLVEIEAINWYRRRGVKLINLTDGGDGPSGFKHSEATKLQYRARRASDETKRKLSAMRKGRPATHILSAEERAKLLATHLGVPSPLRGKKMKPRSLESRAKQSATMMGRTLSAESRVKLSASKTGKRLSPESLASRREKIRQRSEAIA